MKRILTYGVVLILALLLTIPGVAAEKTIRIAAIITSLTGPAAQNGVYMTNAIKMAVDEINAKGGVRGQKIEVVFLDDQAKASEAINAVRKAIYDIKTPVILGPDWSGLVLACMPIAAKEGIPQIVSATNVRITNQGVPTIFRMRANDSIPAKAIAEYVTQKGFKKIGIMYTNEDYGKGFMEETQKNLTRLGNPARVIESCNLGDTDFTAQVLSFKNSGADMILALGKEIELAKFLRQTRELGVKTPVMGGSTFGIDYVVELAGGAMEGVKIVTHFLPSDPDPTIQEFVKRYMKLYKHEPETHIPCYYDTMHFLAQIMEKYGTTPAAITKGLKELKYKGIQSWYIATPEGDLVTKQVVGEFKNGKWIVTDVLGE
ncbi:MAG TPA: ABC transporter substrate-binding protein [Firmicutes bacterium]|nr:ABC transporter substrate-binding protein [Bacillota bacterium]